MIKPRKTGNYRKKLKKIEKTECIISKTELEIEMRHFYLFRILSCTQKGVIK